MNDRQHASEQKRKVSFSTCVAERSWLLLLLRAKAGSCRATGAIAKSTACVVRPAKWCLSSL